MDARVHLPNAGTPEKKRWCASAAEPTKVQSTHVHPSRSITRDIDFESQEFLGFNLIQKKEKEQAKDRKNKA